jgi:hypothetical protein
LRSDVSIAAIVIDISRSIPRAQMKSIVGASALKGDLLEKRIEQ